MVRLINQDNLKQVTDIVYSMMKLQEFFTYAEEFNNPGISPCIYAMWHENQLVFMVYLIEKSYMY